MFISPREQDVVEYFAGVLIQHGPLNDRIYLMNLEQADPKIVIKALTEKAEHFGYTKIFAKIPASAAKQFILSGFRIEARVPLFFNRTEDALFLGYYLDERRSHEKEIVSAGVAPLNSTRNNRPRRVKSSCASIRHCSIDDADVMADIYRQVFATYPFPIGEPGYLVKQMQTGVSYFGVECEGSLVSLAAIEADSKASAAEMTDFGTLTEWRGNGYARDLLKHMEVAAKRAGILTAFTIARTNSPGMNYVFLQGGYSFGGRLINNTNISGNIESMNVWHKALS